MRFGDRTVSDLCTFSGATFRAHLRYVVTQGLKPWAVLLDHFMVRVPLAPGVHLEFVFGPFS
jgi:hypothetical protein